MRIVIAIVAIVAVIGIGLLVGLVGSRSPAPRQIAADSEPVAATNLPPRPVAIEGSLALVTNQPKPAIAANTPARPALPVSPSAPEPAELTHAIPSTDREAMDAAWQEKLTLRKSDSPLLSYAYEHARLDDLEIVKKILDAHPDFITNVVGTAQSTLLHTAAFNGRTDMVNELLERHPDVNTQNAEGHTPLFDSIRSGNLDIIRALLEHGADLTIPTQAGQTPLQMAAQMNRPDIVALLRQWGEKP